MNPLSLLKVRFHLTGQRSPKPTPTRWWCHISWKRKPCVTKGRASAGDGEAFWEGSAKIVRVCEHEYKIPPLLPSYWWYNSFRLLSWKRKGTGWLDLAGGGGKMISRGGCLTAFGIRIFECQAPIWIEVHCVCACACVCADAVLMTEHIIQFGTDLTDLWSQGWREDFCACVNDRLRGSRAAQTRDQMDSMNKQLARPFAWLNSYKFLEFTHVELSVLFLPRCAKL